MNNNNKLPTSIDAAASVGKSQSAGKAVAKGPKLAGGSMRKLLLSSTTDSVDLEEFEIDLTTDDDEAITTTTTTTPLPSSTSLKTPLITETSSPDKKGAISKSATKTKTPAKLTLNLSSSKNGGSKTDTANVKTAEEDEEDDDDEEEDEDDICETTRFSKSSSSSLNTPPPITIGKIKIFNPGRRRRVLRLRRLLKRLIVTAAAVVLLLLLLYNSDRLPALFSSVLGWLTGNGGGGSEGLTRGGKDGNSRCSRLASRPVWRTNFPMLTVESALRLVDANNDSVLDVVVPFGSGIDAAYYDATLCQIYFNQTEMESKTIGCGGGVMAVDGASGVLLWSLATAHELFASNCNLDINGDGVKDCVFGGRMASLYAVDGRTGAVFWSITSTFGEPVAETSNFYTALLVPKDVDGDGLADLVVMHGGDPLRAPGARVRNVAKLMVISAKTGAILSWAPVPDGAESYYSPQLLVHPDGTALVLFGTGGETHPGGLYVVALEALLSGNIKHSCRTLLLDCCKGFISPPVLIDLTGDGVLDIVMSAFNASVLALDGATFEVLWRRAFPGGETYSSPAVGYFNDDGVADFAVSYQYGPGFPIYFYAEFHVLDGRNGEELLRGNGGPVRMPIGTQSSPLTVSTGAANDVFLFWYSGCANGSSSSSSGSGGSNQTSDLSDNGPYQISPGATVHDSSRADFCRLRFGEQARQYTQYRAITQYSSMTLYDSRRDEPPPVQAMNATAIAYQWYADNVQAGETGDQSGPAGDNLVDGRGGVWGPLDPAAAAQGNNAAFAVQQQQLQPSIQRTDQVVFSGGDAFEQLRKYKKLWPPLQRNSDDDDNGGGGGQFTMDNLQQQQQQQSYQQNSKKRRRREQPRVKRHVGLHNGDSVQRVISTGTLAPALLDQQSVDTLGSIDVLFATYSFPPAANVKLMSPAMRRCIGEYLAPEREAQLRLLDDSSLFKRLGYDHDAYEAAVKDICAKENGAGEGGGGGPEENKEAAASEANPEDNPVKANDWIRPMGSMTLHRVNLKCYDQSADQNDEKQQQQQQVPIKEYLHQWWPGYLGLLADCIVNMIDE